VVQSPTFANFDSKWFRSYSRVVLETNPDLARVYLGYAVDAIDEQLTKAEEPERQAMLAALRDLQVLQRRTEKKNA
jgi:formate-dependent nitrite reductase cytochrome c552 subunit